MFLLGTCMNIVKVRAVKRARPSLIIVRHLCKELRRRKNLWESVNLVNINMLGKQGVHKHGNTETNLPNIVK